MKFITCICSCGCKNEIPNYNVTGLCLHCYRDHRNLKEYLTASKYQCGHQIKPVFIKKDIVQFSLYRQWKESGSKLCFKCWDEKRKKEFLKLSRKVLDENKKSKCEICGKRYETYPIIFCDNPVCVVSFLEKEEKPDGTFRRICKECRDKEEKQYAERKTTVPEKD
jgi:hypothetical protein